MSKTNWLLLNKKGQLAKKEKFSEKDADPKELAMGIEIEKEHTNNPQEAKAIALDHLAEIPDYYSRLKTMEEQAKSKKD